MTGPRIPGARIGRWQPSQNDLRKARLREATKLVKADGHVPEMREPPVGDKPYNNLRWGDENPTRAGLKDLAELTLISEPALIRRAVEMLLRDYEADPVGTFIRMTSLWLQGDPA